MGKSLEYMPNNFTLKKIKLDNSNDCVYIWTWCDLDMGSEEDAKEDSWLQAHILQWLLIPITETGNTEQGLICVKMIINLKYLWAIHVGVRSIYRKYI